MSKIYQKITDLIGGTPLLELANYEKKNNLEATVLGKLSSSQHQVIQVSALRRLQPQEVIKL